MSYEVELEVKKMEDDYSGQYKVTSKTVTEGSSGKTRNFSKFQSTLGMNKEDWEVYIELSNGFKLPFSENSFEAAISTNEVGEETTTVVWNSFQSRAEDAAVRGELGDNVQSEVRDELFGWDELESLALSMGSQEVASDVVDGDKMSGCEVNNGEKKGVELEPGSVEDQDLPRFERDNGGVLTDSGQNSPSGGEEGAGSKLKQSQRYSCLLCSASGIKDKFNLERHMVRMHSGSFECSICQIEFTDRYSFNIHYSQCYHYCPIVNCPFKEKRKSRMDAHVRKHCRM